MFLFANTVAFISMTALLCRVKSGNFRHQVNQDIHLQTVEI